MRTLSRAVLCSVIAVAAAPAADAGCPPLIHFYGGCVDPCASAICGPCAPPCAPAPPPCYPLDIGPATEMRVVLVPSYFTEKRTLCATTYREESRTRAYRVYRTVPVEEERVCVRTVFVPKTETKIVPYKVTIPVTVERTHEYTTTVPVWTEVEETYNIKVPVLKDVEETYFVEVPVLTDVEFTYTVNVPYPVTYTVMRTITNVTPVTRVRRVPHCVPVTRTRMVARDYGQWETHVVCAPAPCAPAPFICGDCCCYEGYGAGCMPQIACAPPTPITTRVWVPRIVHEEETVVDEQCRIQEIRYTVYEQYCDKVPYECTKICYRPEARIGTRKAVSYVKEPRTRTRKVAEYVTEPRTRINRILTFQEEKRVETYPHVTYKQEVREKEIVYTVKVPQEEIERRMVTRYDCVADERIETFMVRVPVPDVREVEYQVCRMVPRVVSAQINPCPECCPPCGPCGH